MLISFASLLRKSGIDSDTHTHTTRHANLSTSSMTPSNPFKKKNQKNAAQGHQSHYDEHDGDCDCVDADAAATGNEDCTEAASEYHITLDAPLGTSKMFHLHPYPKFSLDDHHVELEEVAFLTKKTPKNSTSKKTFVHRYLMREALVNRAMFLIIAGLIAVFIVLVCNGGMINNMEWIRDNILSEASGAWEYARENEILPLCNVISVTNANANANANKQTQTRHLLLVFNVPVLGSSSMDFMAVPQTMELLKTAGKHLPSIGLNTTAVLFSPNDKWLGTERRMQIVNYGAIALPWTIQLMDQTNASSMPELMFLLLERMDVSVLFMDVMVARASDLFKAFLLPYELYLNASFRVYSNSKAYSTEYPQVYSNGSNPPDPNEINPPDPNGCNPPGQKFQIRQWMDSMLILMPVPICMDPAIKALVSPPSIPFFDSRTLLAWQNTHTANLFGDAASKMQQNRQLWNQTYTLPSFLLNMLVNDGRKCSQVTEAGTEAGMEAGKKTGSNANALNVSHIENTEDVRLDRRLGLQYSLLQVSWVKCPQ